MSLLDTLLGRPLASSEQAEQKIGVLAGLPTLGLDGLSSAAYGPEAALTILLPLGALGLDYIGPVIAVIVALLSILYLSYRQTMAAYPSGGGSYTVAKENLGIKMGLLAAAALLLDYILNVAVGISAGVGALVSALPALHDHTLALCLGTLALITLVNLRGVRESGIVFGVPTYLFIGSLLVVLGFGVVRALGSGGHPAAVAAPPPVPAGTEAVSLWLLMRAFASGCTAMTGVEAVSNGVGAFAKPAVRNAQWTLTAIVAILAALLGGVAYLCHAYGIVAMDENQGAYQSVLSQLVAAVVGRGPCYYVTIGSVLAVLALSANTSFADFPRLCHLIAEDDYLPHGFAVLGRRLVYSLGITILAVFSAILLIVFRGITDALIPLFAIGAFLAFTLSQAGMVEHWKRNPGPHFKLALGINLLGAICTGIALGIILVAKFTSGAWITCLIIPVFVTIFLRVKAHYAHVVRDVAQAGQVEMQCQDLVALLPIKNWDAVTAKALSLALRFTGDVVALHVATDEAEGGRLREKWKHEVAAMCHGAGFREPELVVVPSPYRRLLGPLLDCINNIKERYPDRIIVVIIPELVENSLWAHLLHNKRATALKAALLFYGDRHIVVMNVPWYLSPATELPPPPQWRSARFAIPSDPGDLR